MTVNYHPVQCGYWCTGKLPQSHWTCSTSSRFSDASFWHRTSVFFWICLELNGNLKMVWPLSPATAYLQLKLQTVIRETLLMNNSNLPARMTHAKIHSCATVLAALPNCLLTQIVDVPITNPERQKGNWFLMTFSGKNYCFCQDELHVGPL